MQFFKINDDYTINLSHIAYVEWGVIENEETESIDREGTIHLINGEEFDLDEAECMRLEVALDNASSRPVNYYTNSHSLTSVLGEK